jgi:prepilin-type N-terminal cleavage/methylation domain-containing protein
MGIIKAFEKKQKGFTLIELLTSVIVLVVVGSVIMGIVSSSLKGANKTNTIENIRQNGNYVLNQISKDLEYALPFDGETTGLIKNNGECCDAICSHVLAPTPSALETSYNSIVVKSLNSDTLTEYYCGDDPDLASSEIILTANGMPLLDTSLVNLESCSFACVQDSIVAAPVIKIKFSLGSKTTSKLAENKIINPIVFETSVALRNYRK